MSPVRSIKSFFLVALFSSGLCLAQYPVALPAGPMDSGSAPTSVPKAPVLFDMSAIDKSVDPCTDFYKFACGNWVKHNPIPADRTRYGSFDELSDHNNYLLYTELRSAADAPKSPLQKKYGDFFASCMNTTEIEKLGVKPISPQLDEIGDIKDKKQLAAFNVEMEKKYGHGALFGVAVTQDQKDSTQQILATGQGGLALPDRDYYLVDDARSTKIREQYKAHVARMFVLLGDSPEKADLEAANVLRLETELAKGSMARVDLRDPAKRYHILTVAEVQALSPGYNWKQYLDGRGLANVRTIDVVSPGFVSAVNQVIETEPLDALKSYMRWHTVHSAAPMLSKAFEDENFDFFNRTLTGQKEEQPRWKRCTRSTDAALGEAVGQDWVKKNFPPDAKANMEKLVTALESALAEDIKSLPWMSDATKLEAKAKLDAFRQKIGYPDTWRDYTTLAVKRDDAVGNMQRAQLFEARRNLAKLGQPVDEKEWSMTPPTVNAYYNPSNNDINFPAGILQPPFFDNAMDPAVNFGAIGAVIGHEMTHGFDDQGSKYDKSGNVRQWWTDEDRKKFDARTGCEVKEYDGFQVAEGQNLNGKLTLGENTADNGGIRIAFQALQATLASQPNGPAMEKAARQKDGFTADQRFFLAFGQVWCANQTPESARVLAKTDPHSTGEWRVKGTVQNFEEFGKAFGCKAGQPMTPANACRVW